MWEFLPGDERTREQFDDWCLTLFAEFLNTFVHDELKPLSFGTEDLTFLCRFAHARNRPAHPLDEIGLGPIPLHPPELLRALIA